MRSLFVDKPTNLIVRSGAQHRVSKDGSGSVAEELQSALIISRHGFSGPQRSGKTSTGRKPWRS